MLIDVERDERCFFTFSAVDDKVERQIADTAPVIGEVEVELFQAQDLATVVVSQVPADITDRALFVADDIEMHTFTGFFAEHFVVVHHVHHIGDLRVGNQTPVSLRKDPGGESFDMLQLFQIPDLRDMDMIALQVHFAVPLFKAIL